MVSHDTVGAGQMSTWTVCKRVRVLVNSWVVKTRRTAPAVVTVDPQIRELI